MPPSLVSICMPVYNGAALIGQAIESALGQTYETFELVVVDNRSTDETRETVRAIDDERIRLEVNDVNVGPIENHNRCVELARGSVIKFLHHDDLLSPDCLESMLRIFDEQPSVGLVFSPREILLDDPEDPAAIEWKDSFAALHEGFRSLHTVNRGHDLLDQYLPSFRRPPIQNWIGEPTAVMIRRACFDTVGPFNARIKQAFELDMWLRIMGSYDVGFVERPLVSFRHHQESLSATTARAHDNWLDRLWILEDLLRDPAFRPWRGMLRAFRRRELLRATKSQAGRLLRGAQDLRPLRDYLRYRISG